MRASTLAAPGVLREVPDCTTDLSKNAHRLLTHLTRTKSTNRHNPRVKGDVQTWARALGLTTGQVSEAFIDIGPDEDRGGNQMINFNSRGQLIVAIPCTCPVRLEADSSIPPGDSETEQSGRGGVPELAPPVSSPAPGGRKLDWDSDEEETPKPRRKKRAAPGPDTPYGLATYFTGKVCSLASRQGIRLLPGSINQDMLMRHMRTMKTDLSADEIRTMVDSFANRYATFHKPGADPGKVFLAHRRRLFAEAHKRSAFVTERDITKFKQSAGIRYASPDDI